MLAQDKKRMIKLLRETAVGGKGYENDNTKDQRRAWQTDYCDE